LKFSGPRGKKRKKKPGRGGEVKSILQLSVLYAYDRGTKRERKKKTLGRGGEVHQRKHFFKPFLTLSVGREKRKRKKREKPEPTGLKNFYHFYTKRREEERGKG